MLGEMLAARELRRLRTGAPTARTQRFQQSDDRRRIRQRPPVIRLTHPDATRAGAPRWGAPAREVVRRSDGQFAPTVPVPAFADVR
jgi:hypothetical protein